MQKKVVKRLCRYGETLLSRPGLARCGALPIAATVAFAAAGTSSAVNLEFLSPLRQVRYRNSEFKAALESTGR